MTRQTTRTRLDSPAAVEQMARANGVQATRTSHAASVWLGDAFYFWAA